MSGLRNNVEDVERRQHQQGCPWLDWLIGTKGKRPNCTCAARSVNPLGALVLATARGERSGPLKSEEQRAVARQVAEAIHRAKERTRGRK